MVGNTDRSYFGIRYPDGGDCRQRESSYRKSAAGTRHQSAQRLQLRIERKRSAIRACCKGNAGGDQENEKRLLEASDRAMCSAPSDRATSDERTSEKAKMPSDRAV